MKGGKKMKLNAEEVKIIDTYRAFKRMGHREIIFC